jgi:tRNA(Ile)-lysidine synthase
MAHEGENKAADQGVREAVEQSALRVIRAHGLADAHTPVMLMVSGGSDSTALAYVARALVDTGVLGPVAMLHVNHRLRGADADDDALFVEQLAQKLGFSLYLRSIDVAAHAAASGENLEACARRLRYAAAFEALGELCREAGTPTSEGRLFTAHTADDRVENFYMRSIVGTGPGGFRSMRYLNGPVARPFLEVGRADLRAYIEARAETGLPVARDDAGALWREDATNEHTDRFRAYVRKRLVPVAKERNPHLLPVLTRTMNLIADEDDMLAHMADDLAERTVAWIAPEEVAAGDAGSGCVLAPSLGRAERPLARRVVVGVLKDIRGPEERVDAADVEAVLDAFGPDGRPRGGYVRNIQGNLAVSANKRGVRIEPMQAFRARRKRG